ncbi:cadherin EGF LAG seven-pass G-type receptor 2-like isoform X2 [Lineus longissimus]|uniref:cadherin EGF LAG seven-pass G-type receptor 2-like isoform X2 n=1 Tax=Lineus longissimus TaxID=88925 RepID=UPI002B4F3A63
MGDYHSQMWRIVSVILFLCHRLSCAFDVNLNVDAGASIGVTIFNASLGPGWSYKLLPVKGNTVANRHVTSFLSVDRHGRIIVKSLPRCINRLGQQQNPYTVYVISETIKPSTNYSMIPVNVHLHGRNCFTKFRRKSQRLLYSSPVLGYRLNWQQGVCLSPYTHIVNILNNLPLSIKKCVVGYRTDTENVRVRSDGSLQTRGEVCIVTDTWIIGIKLSVICGTNDSELPLKVVLLSKNGLERDFKVHHSIKHLHRMKRDTNDFTPIFPEPYYVRNVTEEKPAGLFVDTINATDDDSGAAGQITYSLTATRDGRSQGMFKIDPNSGRITTTQKLDREEIGEHYFTIYAKDGGTSFKNTGQASLTIRVDDVNDHTPSFEIPRYFHEEAETASIGSTVLTVRATDQDSGENAKIKYSIMNPEPPNDVFSLDESLGTITTAKKLDRETTEQYTLIVKAQDQSLNIQDRREATATVVITIKDMNDNYPQFEKNSYTVRVREDIDWKSQPVIGTIMAHDADLGPNGLIRYSITGGNTRDTFKINEVNGQLSVVKQLNYEDTYGNSYNLKVRAQDSGSPSKANSTTVLVVVEDVNDNSPRFITMNFQERILENVDPGYEIVRVQAFDQDSGANSEISYSIINAPANMPIVIDSKTGRITTSGPLDREKTDRYSFSVQARDHGTPPRSDNATVKITITDVNDNAPVFKPNFYEKAISEEVAPGELVETVTATDADTDLHARVTYSISGGNTRQAFNIHGQSGLGLISVARNLDYKEQNRYVLTVTATDPGGLSTSCTVIVNITDANTYRPVFKNTPYVAKVNEDVKVGVSVFQVSATDDDVGENARISYTMDASDVFRLDPSTGILYTKKPLDRESTPGYTISVTATDHGHPIKSDTTDLEIQIIDVNDNFPEFKQTVYNGTINENAVVGTSVITVTATDKDQGSNGAIRYTFDGGNSGNGDFSIDATLGIIRTAKALDRELVANYELKAFAVDRGASKKSTAVKINIQVSDVNDNRPKFDSLVINLDINENEPIGSTVGKIVARDPDEGQNAHVEYSIVGGVDRRLFELGPSKDGAAVILSKTELDYERGKRDYEIKLRATSAPLFSDVLVVIHVKDINDNPPELQNFKIIFNNFINHFPTGYIGRVPAHDPDVSDKLSYRFLSGNEGNVLHLNTTTGMIRLDSRLNSDVPKNGTLKVSVSDGKNEIDANCELSVKLVTDNMLFNSITVRLNNMSQTAFLSHIYELFLRGLASIFETDKRNIFIINVQDDTDVATKILNVSFSVRKMIRNNQEYFHPPQDLREKVYLRRVLLAQLSTAEVLPFDDNLCVREPCLNHEVCMTILKFGNASSFIASDTMLFRPIRPVNSYNCSCPKGFTGMEASYLCDTEVNLCYSSPCGENGTCIQREGGYSCDCKAGFTGEQCQYDMRNTNYVKDSCPENVCRPPSRCVPETGGGFSCVGCPRKDYHTEFCEVTTRGFTKGTFLMFPSLRRTHRFRIRLRFSTREKNGLLFYNGRYNEKHDFVALEIIDGQVQFSFSLGSNITTASAFVKGGVHDGSWHEVSVDYLNRSVTLTVGEDCDPALAINHLAQYGSRCAVTVSHPMEERCAILTEFCHRYLDLTGPLQIGGLPNLETEFQVKNKEFSGCMKDFYIDDDFLDLGSYVYNNGTVEGCPQLQKFCDSSPCANGGTCHNGWGTFVCRCTNDYGGQDCKQRIAKAKSLAGNSYLVYQLGLTTIQIPWYSGVSFRTTKDSGLLMQVQIGRDTAVTMEIKSGYIQYTYPGETILFDTVKVNDGEWHYIEVGWLKTALVISLDYGQVEQQYDMSTYVNEKTISEVFIGGVSVNAGGSTKVEKGLTGCVENVRLGGSQNAVLGVPTTTYNANEGCSSPDPCARASCPVNSECVNKFDTNVCVCHKGYFGPLCSEICETANPCKHGATCRTSASASHGYRCECTEFHSGQYCENLIGQPCPASWWGFPICGPCNCPTSNGYNPSCNKTTGECSCMANHYVTPGGQVCRPCRCDPLGSLVGPCDQKTGQCQCKTSVIGRQCNQCGSKYAEVKEKGCETVFKKCPKSWSDHIWWRQADYGVLQTKSCPLGTVGKATRFCSKENIWSAPDTFSCMSINFEKMQGDLIKIEKGNMKMNTFLSKTLMERLDKATRETKILYGSDVDIGYRSIKQVLIFENAQAGLNLTHTQDKNFIQNMMNSLDRIFNPKFQKMWGVIQTRSGGSSDLMYHLEKYVTTLARNMEVTLIPAFDVVTDNLVLGVDKIAKNLGNETVIPKYNNKVQNMRIFDKTTQIVMPKSVYDLKGVLSGLSNQLTDDADVGYIFYKTLGEILPSTYEKTVRIPKKVPLKVNSPVISLKLISNNNEITGKLPDPITLEMKQLTDFNRTSPQCVYWKYTNLTSGSGEWSSAGCTVINRTAMKIGASIITCQCNHMTSFAVLMDETDVEYEPAGPITVEIITYVGLVISCTCLLLAMLFLCCLRRLQNNMHSIHINLMWCIFVGEILYMCGIGVVNPELACRIIAIFLHFFFMSAFAWMFVESLHLYRMMTEIRDINTGSMKFYYAVGYVIPGIIVGLAVGLSTESYGNGSFCWLSTRDQLIWSFVGPVCIVYVMNVIVFFMALKASFNVKSEDEQHLFRVGLVAAMFLLPLLGMAWVFGLLSVNENSLAFHYLFAIFCLLQGLFLLLGHIILNPRARWELKRTWAICQGEKEEDLDDDLANTRTTTLSRSALAYHQDSSIHDGLSRINMGISTTSTTSRSTSKTSSGGYKPDGFTRSTGSTTTSKDIPSEFQNPAFGFDSSFFHDKPVGDPDTGEVSRRRRRHDSDSDSDLSIGRASLDLASSHSSDDDDDDDDVGWGPMVQPKNKVLERVKAQTKPKGPQHSTPIVPPPYTPNKPQGWQGELAPSTTSESDVNGPAQIKVKVTERRGSQDRKLGNGYRSNSPRSKDTNADQSTDLDSSISTRGSVDQPPSRHPPPYNIAIGSRASTPASMTGSPQRPLSPNTSFPSRSMSPPGGTPPRSTSSPQNVQSGERPLSPSRHPKSPLTSNPPQVAPKPRGVPVPPPRISVQVLTHNGSISSNDESKA